MSSSKFKVRVVYGVRRKLEITLLGNLRGGAVQEGMFVSVSLNGSRSIGKWPIIELLEMDFLNADDFDAFTGLVLRCEDEKSFDLLKALRVYEEEVEILPAEVKEKEPAEN